MNSKEFTQWLSADWVGNINHWVKEKLARHRFNKVYRSYIRTKQEQLWILRIEEEFWLDLAAKMHSKETDEKLADVQRTRMLIEAIVDFFKKNKIITSGKNKKYCMAFKNTSMAQINKSQLFFQVCLLKNFSKDRKK